MARQTSQADFSAVLESAQVWVNRCLVGDGSLFSAGTLWTAELIGTVHRAFVDHPDESSAGFSTKLAGQMERVGGDGQRLMAEALWALLLFPRNISATTKRQQIEQMAQRSGTPVDVHHPLLGDAVLRGIGSGGPGFNNHRPKELAYFFDVVLAIKRLTPTDRRETLTDYDRFVAFIDQVPQQGKRQYRHMLRYILFPDRVERMSSNADRRRILEGFQRGALRATRDWTDQQLDDALLALRQELEREQPDRPLDFYEAPLRDVWNAEDSGATADEPSARLRFDRASALSARRAAESMCPDPAPRAAALALLARAIRHVHAQAAGAWSVTLHPNVIRLNVGMMIAVDLRRRGILLVVNQPSLDEAMIEAARALEYPEHFRYLEGAVGYVVPYSEIEPAATQLEPACLALIDRSLEKSSKAPFRDAHSPGILKYLRLLGHDVPSPAHEAPNVPVIESPSTIAPPDPRPMVTLADIADETGVSEELLAGWVRAINRKGQAIIYGPPGTGKTFIARRLAEYLTSAVDPHVELVQFHPAYAYEDFIQGLRPHAQVGGQLRYELVPGRFMEFCTAAAARSGASVMIIDEINRANVPQVFGELMYLLEYRGDIAPLAGGNTLRIPANVRIIGTMNTADRSIALMDHALRRRFAFIPLQPDYDVLQRFHAKRGRDAGGLVQTLQRINVDIRDPHFAIGISYFMRDDLSDHLEPIWRGEIEPYLEELFFDRRSDADRFRWESIASPATLASLDASDD